jgi:putative hemolysin
MKKMLIATAILAALLVAACGAEPTPTPEVGLPNPASVFCEEQGYELEIREEEGGSVGYCLFPDGSECEEWAFYRGECKPASDTFESPLGLPNPASEYCLEQGGQLEMRTAADGSQTGYCLFPDGTECEEWAFFRGECGPGTSQP